jgi:hypothetical protein
MSSGRSVTTTLVAAGTRVEQKSETLEDRSGDQVLATGKATIVATETVPCDLMFTTGKQYWGNYQPLPSQTAHLAEGRHVLCVRFDATPFNFGGLEFTPVAAAAPQ